MNKQSGIILLIFILIRWSFCIEPITFGLSTLGVAVGIVKIDTIIDNTWCRFRECCTDSYINFDRSGLKSELESNLFGQHIAIHTILSSLSGHYDNIGKSKKPLVMTFHGTPGTGKNYVTDFIVSSVFKKQHESNYVHKFMGRKDFPQDSQVDTYRQLLRDKITTAIKNCPRSIFIFDEVDKMPSGIFDAITPFLEFHNTVDGLNYREAVYIFLTNSGGYEIGMSLAAMMRKGKTRETIRLNEFDLLLQTAAYHLNGGLQKGGPISAALIDYYIPFLPLERHHVKRCIEVEFTRMRQRFRDSEVEDILNETIVEEETGLFVTSGCKRISKQVMVRVGSHNEL